jgi:hypothetical protein
MMLFDMTCPFDAGKNRPEIAVFAITGGRLYEQVRIQQEWQSCRIS